MPCSPDWVPVIKEDQDTDEISGIQTLDRPKYPLEKIDAILGM
jgi:hypothetical protein